MMFPEPHQIKRSDYHVTDQLQYRELTSFSVPLITDLMVESFKLLLIATLKPLLIVPRSLELFGFFVSGFLYGNSSE